MLAFRIDHIQIKRLGDSIWET